MSFRFHPEAEAEFLAAIDWYAERSANRGDGFASEIFAAIQLAVSMSLAWLRVEGEVRRILVTHFPYGVLYAPRDGWIYLLAVMNVRRQPDYWHSRS